MLRYPVAARKLLLITTYIFIAIFVCGSRAAIANAEFIGVMNNEANSVYRVSNHSIFLLKLTVRSDGKYNLTSERIAVSRAYQSFNYNVGDVYVDVYDPQKNQSKFETFIKQENGCVVEAVYIESFRRSKSLPGLPNVGGWDVIENPRNCDYWVAEDRTCKKYCSRRRADNLSPAYIVVGRDSANIVYRALINKYGQDA